jgi:two-component system sensor histidine kinase RegB
MWVAFLSAAILIGFFVTRVRAALDAREGALAEARRVAAAQERLASLTTLAAGAAHELATPLATIAVASQELLRAVEARQGLEEITEDARLIRTQVERCRQILDHMSGRADASTVDPPMPIDVSAVVRAAIDALPSSVMDRVIVQVDSIGPVVRLPRVGVARVLTTLLKNAIDASPSGSPVEIAVTSQDDQVRFAVRDHGRGMDHGTLARAGEPFFTTKPPGAGFGLGLFLARTFVEQWGGRFILSSEPGQGTLAAVEFAVDGRT